MKRRILVTTGTRAEYGILRKLLEEIKNSKKLELVLVVTGSHLLKKHGYTIQEIKDDGFKIDAKIKFDLKKDDAFSNSIALGKLIIDFAKIFKKFKPDINIVLGDRDEMLSSAVAASHMNIPNAHIHGGDVSGGMDEYNRHAITKLSNIHFAATKKSKDRILKMGENPKFVFNTGSPSMDAIMANEITKKNILEKKYGVKFTGSEILLVQHSVTTEINQSKKQIETTLKAISKTKKTTIVIAPNTDPGNLAIFDTLREYTNKNNFIKYFQNMPRSDYLGFLKNCAVLVGNSSSGIIESTLFDTAVINLGIRQKGRERGNNVIDIEQPTSTKIYAEIVKSLKKSKNKNKMPLFGDGKSSKRIVKYLEHIPINKKLIQKQISY